MARHHSLLGTLIMFAIFGLPEAAAFFYFGIAGVVILFIVLMVGGYLGSSRKSGA